MALLAGVIVAGAVGGVVLYTFSRAYASPLAFTNATGGDAGALRLSQLAFAAVMAVFLVLAAWALFARRDAGAVLALAAGLVTGVVAAIISAPIAAYVFGGVTGFGGDVMIVVFRAAGASLYEATLQQGLLSDPLDKMVSCLLVFLVVTALPRRLVARFPNGERLAHAPTPRTVA